jgi:hypothetical protein
MKGKEKLETVDKASARIVYQLTSTEAALAAGAGVSAVPAPGGHINFMVGGRIVFSLNLTLIPLVPACTFQETQAGDTYTFTCTVAPVPVAVLNSLSH